jgi:isopentenyl-diphosphate delta-isomerase
VGAFDGEARPDPAEVDELRWVECDDLERDVAARPEGYTPWFAQILARLPELRRAA